MNTQTSTPRRLLRRRASSTLALLFAISSGALACSVSTDTAPPGEPAATHHEHAPTPHEQAQATSQLPFELPAWTNEGPPREVQVLAEDSHLKVAAVALRRGTPLPTHAVAERVSIQVVEGRGALLAGSSTSEVGPKSVVLLDPEVPHAMTPADDELVVLLVHYLKR